MKRLCQASLPALLCTLALGCGGQGSGTTSDGGSDGKTDLAVSGPDLAVPTIPYQTLSQYGFFTGTLNELVPAAGVIPYDVISTLYADGAQKLRFISVPAGKQIHFDPAERFTFPDGTTIIKNFYFPLDARMPAGPRRLMETRLLIQIDGAWDAQTYVWSDDQTEATRFVAGETFTVAYTGSDGSAASVDYQIPASSQCKTCHGQNTIVVPLGPRARQLDRLHDYGAGPENQLTHLAALGLFDAPLPDLSTVTHLSDPAGTDSLELRARSYLDANCAHCHNEEGFASSTSLRLNFETTVAIDLGVCRHPVAAGPASGGFLYDVNPGLPDQSIMLYRMKSNDPQSKMPPLPLTTSDSFGVSLIHDWIAALTDPACP